METDPDVVRFLMEDSSEFCKRDWLMTRALEVKGKDLVSVAKAGIQLVNSIRLFVYNKIHKRDASDDSESEADSNTCGVPDAKRRKTRGHELEGFVPEPEWIPLLNEVRKVNLHCYTPAAMASGRRGVADKAAGVIHQFHIDAPSRLPLDRYCDLVASNTSDMGDEMGVPSFKVYQALGHSC